jgi:MFS family permease
VGDDAAHTMDAGGGAHTAPALERKTAGGSGSVGTPDQAPVTGPGRRRGRRGRKKGRDARAPYGWWPVVVIISVALVDRLESSVLSAILVDLQAEWGFSDTAGGALSSAISIMGTALALPAGYLADRANRKNLLAIVVALWSFITLGSAVSISFMMFFATRLALAAADSIDNPSQVSLLADYYSVEVRPKVLGFHRMITFAGGALGTLYGGIVTQLWGWRAVFYIIIVPGLVVAWWCYRLQEPRRGEADARAAQAGLAAASRHGGSANGSGNGASGADHGDLAEIRAAEDGVLGQPSADDVKGNGSHVPTGGTDAEEPGASSFDAVNLTQEKGFKALWVQIKTVLRIRTIVLVYAGLAVLFFGLGGIFFWLPTFYQRTFGLEPGPAGSITAGITLFGVVGGTWIGGVIGERVHGKVKGGRVVAGGTGIFCGSLVFPLSLNSGSLTGQALFLLVSVTLMSIAIPNLQSAIADALPANQRGVGFSLLGIFTTFGAFGPLLVGMISDATGSLNTAFGYLLIPMVLGGLVTVAGRTTFDRDVQRALDEVMAAAGHTQQGATHDDPAPAASDASGAEDHHAGDAPTSNVTGAAVHEAETRTSEPEDERPAGEAGDHGAEEARQVLAGVRGLGPAKVAALVEHFGSLDAIRAADVEQLTAVPGIGRSLAEAIRTHLEG